jgi:cephalosporin hydroxylase
VNYGEARELAIEAVMHQYAAQDPGELAGTLLAVAAVRPERICEIGCLDGGTLWCWRACGAQHVYGITAPVNNPGWVRPHGATLMFGDSHDPVSRTWLVAQLAGELLDVLFIDGDHTAAGVRADWADYSPLVRPGGLVVIHDIALMPDVAGFWAELKAAPRPAGREFREICAGGDAPGAGFITIEGAS